MSMPKSAKRSPWLWIGLLLVLTAGVSSAGDSRKASSQLPAAGEIVPGTAHADRDTLELQLD
jgi:hypothetical protein